ncbi:MAG TPA: hypothetical protein VLD63_13770 [Anaerolineales bacterium]|nr:hypothetical protein [Anaerolineales bacterium]
MNLPSIYLGVMISSLLAAAFHLLRGGTLARLLLYLGTAWLSFFTGQWLSTLLHWELGRVGSLNLFPAILATVIGLIAASILAGPSGGAKPKATPPNDAEG